MSTQSAVTPYQDHAKPKFRQPPPSPIEIAFWKAGKPLIAELEREVNIGPYRVDFLIPGRKVVIELYGYAWHKAKDKITRDKQRERYLQQQGYHVIGFTGTEVFKDSHACVIEALKCVKGLTGSGVFSAPPVTEAAPMRRTLMRPAPVQPQRRRPAPRMTRGLTSQQWLAVIGMGALDVVVIVLGLLVVSA